MQGKAFGSHVKCSYFYPGNQHWDVIVYSESVHTGLYQKEDCPSFTDI